MSLFRSAAKVSSLTLLSRISGLIRDILIARIFGVGPLTDAFWVAFRIPNLFRRLFAEGAFSQAFVPILGAIRNQADPNAVQQLLDRVALLLTAALTILTIIGVIAAPWLVGAMASGLTHSLDVENVLSSHSPGAAQAAAWMTRIVFPYILCMSLTAFASGVLNTWNYFSITAFTPVLLNLCMIVACIWGRLYIRPPIYALAIGVMAGGIAQLTLQWLALARLGLLPRFSLKIKQAWQDATVQRILRQMLPAILGVSVAQISLLINTNIASWLATGSVTWLSYADRLMEFPTALLGLALGTVLLPSLSRAHARGEPQEYSALLDWGLRLVILLGLPAALGLALLSEGLVATLFHYGAFQAQDVLQTRVAVMAYSVGLIGILLVKILAPAFYARQNIRTPVKIALMVLILTQMMNAISVPTLGHAGLALAIGLGACLNALALFIGLRKQNIYQPCPGWGKFIGRLFPALVILALTLTYVNQHIDWISLRTQPFNRILWLSLTLTVSGTIFFLNLFIFGFRLRDFKLTTALSRESHLTLNLTH